MRKIYLGVIALLLAFIVMPVVKAEKKVPVYMITKDGCPACESAYEYFEGLSQEEPGLFELIPLEVFANDWSFVSDDLQTMFLEIYALIGEDSSKAATPTIVIGDYHTIGLPQDEKEVYNAIVKAKENKTDKISEIAEANGIDISKIRKDSKTAEDASEKANSKDTIIIILIFVILLGGIAGLIFVGRKK